MWDFIMVILLVSALTAGGANIDKDSKENNKNSNDILEQDISYWRTQAEGMLQERVRLQPLEGVAKNLILFLGDGMSIPTVTAARIYMGQLRGEAGESSRLSFEKFPYTGLSKTYCVNKQVADSACTSTAYLGGVKANYGTLGVTAAVPRGNCNKSEDSRNHVDTILDWAQEAGKATGIVTTTRVTHASPAGHYTHSAERDWESDHDMMNLKDKQVDPRSCVDIARQLVLHPPGKNLKVILGGGLDKFLPKNSSSVWGAGDREDGQDLVSAWLRDKAARGRGGAHFVHDREQLLDVDVESTNYLLGLFQGDHMLYHLEEGSEKQPSLAEMTEVAIKLLRKEGKGFYLFVEGGRIDQAHHDNWAMRALDETVEFNKAIQAAVDLVDIEDTLIVVTADHAHTMSMAGYPARGNDILGLSGTLGDDHLPYTTLNYANGPSADSYRTPSRRNATYDNFHNWTYEYPSLVHLKDETHGGDDVAVYARGPWAHLLVGNYEQTLIPHVMSYAARIGPVASLASSSTPLYTPSSLLLLLPLLVATSYLRRLH